MDRRELLERTAIGALPLAAEQAVEAHRGEVAVGGGPHTPRMLRSAAGEVLRAVLAELVQGGLGVGHAAAVRRRLDAAAEATDVRELLRIVCTVGVDVLTEHLRHRAALTSEEEARLRESASRVAAALGGDEVRVVPDDRQVLRRLQHTGVDLR